MLFAQAFSGLSPDTSPDTGFFSNDPSGTEAAAPLAVMVNAGSNGPLCAGSTLNLSATVSDGTAPFTFSWNGPTGFTANVQNPSRPNVSTLDAGVYGVTVTDATGMSGTATVSVEIFLPPLANAGPDKVLCKGSPHQLNGSIGGSANSSVWTASIVGGTFLPNPNMLNAVYSPPATFVGQLTITLTTNDPPGPCPATSDQLTLTYGDPDAMVCNDTVEISMDNDCSVTVTPDMALEGDVLDSLYSVTIFTLQGQNIGNTITSQYVGIPLKIKVTDNCSGNFCITDALVEDVLPPVFVTCESFHVPCVVTNYAPDYLSGTLGISAAYPLVTDNCSGYTLTRNDTWVDVPCGGSFNGMDNLSGYVKRVWTATDASKNKSTCTQYIYFDRVGVFDLQLPADVTASCDVMATNPVVTGTPYYTAFGQQFSLLGTGTFCEISATYADQIIPFCGGTYSIIRTWTIFDLCKPSSPTPPANPFTYVQLINVIDQQGPAIACPANITANTDPLACCATVNLPDVIVDDACGKVQDAYALILVIDPFTGDTIDEIDMSATLSDFPGNNKSDSDTLAVFGNTPCLPIGQHIVYYFSEDACGNSSHCSFKLTVADNVPPVAACDEITQVSLGIDGMILVNATTFDDGSYDNCGFVNFKVRRLVANTCQQSDKFFDQAKFCCEDVGDTVMVILRVYDVPVPPGGVSLTFEEQHSNDCQVEVYIDDKLKPACVPPANVTVSCDNFDPSLWAYGAPVAADNCCVDTITVSASYTQFDTTCSKGTIVRTFHVFDCHGLSNQCTQKVTVEYKQNYYVHFPNDVIVTACNGSGAYGEPTFYGEDCELLGVSFQDQVFTIVPDACFKIERTWTIINWCTYDPNKGCTFVPNPNPSTTLNHPSNLAGPTVSPFGTPSPWAPTDVKINPDDQTTTNYSKYWSADVNCYQYKQIIKIIDTEKPVIQCPASPIEVCDLTHNDPQMWNESYWFDNKFQSHDLCEAPTDLCITATDACSGPNISIRYLLFLDLDGDGTMETVINSLNPPAPSTVSFNNAGSPNYTGGTVRTFDERPVPANQKYQFAIQTIVNGNNKTACLRWNTQMMPNDFVLPQLPYGKHKIKWIVSDGCGNEQVCEYTFIVKDCKPPSLKCFNGLSANLMPPNGMLTLTYNFFLEEATDNCTPDNMLIFGIRHAGTGTGFPFNPDGSPQTTVDFDCTTQSFQVVELWAMDMAGNADYCSTFVHIQDNGGWCSTDNVSVAGMLQTEVGHGLEEADVELVCKAPTGQPPLSMYDMTNDIGQYTFNKAIPIQCQYTVTPVKNNDPLNGVSTFDLVLINKHILGLQPLSTPYKIIAADANNSKSVSTLDVVELRKLILGIYTELPSNTSWRFVDRAYDFPDPTNPFKEPFPESKTVSNIQSNQLDDDFVAIKVGDVNSNSVPNGLVPSDDRTGGTLLFDVTTADGRERVKPGDIFTATFTAAEKVLAYQFTMHFPNLEVINVQPGEGMGDENFAVFADEHTITTSFEVPADADETTFRVTFRANAAGRLSDMLSLSSRVTKAEAYVSNVVNETNMVNDNVTKLEVAFRFDQNGVVTISPVGFELYQNTPNPWVRKTQVGFHLPEDSEATLTVYDEMGRTLFSETADYNRGYNAILIEHALLDAPGVLYYTLETPFGKATRKMVQAQ